MRLIFLGPPGAGKGSQAELISKQFKIAHISTGNILRESADKKTELGIEAKKYMDKGELVPDNIVNKIVWDTINSNGPRNGFLLDGYPRNILQANELENFLKKLNLSLDMVVYFDTTSQTIIKRLTGRMVCPKCGKNYHIINMPPKNDEVCDECNVKLIHREDDSEKTVRNRLKVYNKQIAEILKFYKEKGILQRISGDLDLTTVNNELKELFEKRLHRL